MSQRAVPAMIVQPIFPLGDLNVARWIAGAGGGGEDVLVDPDDAGGLVAVELLAGGLRLTVTVLVVVDPQPATITPRKSSVSRFMTAEPIGRAVRGVGSFI
jgi:hypothetical protein